MKIRPEFVTNSSCASFTVLKKHLSPFQIEQIKNHIEQSNNYIIHRGPQTEIYNDPGDAWGIIEYDTSIFGETMMDNFDMMWFLLQIGVDEGHIEYEGCYGN